MSDLDKNEIKRLKKLDDAFGWRVTVSVKEHFNKVGKYEAFALSPTEDEKKEQMQAMRGLFTLNETKMAMANLKSVDVFMRVARRIGSDAEIGALLPAKAFEAGDVNLLEKCKLDSLAAIVRERLNMGGPR